MVQVITTDFLDGGIAKKNNANAFCFLEEPTYQEGKFGKKLQAKAKLNDSLKTEGVLSLNKTSVKKCAAATGKTDSKEWVGKWFDFVVTTQAVEGELRDVIFVTGLSQKQETL